MNRWDLDEVQPVLSAPIPAGMQDLWNAVPQGYTTSAQALAAIGRSNQQAILAGLGSIQQKALAAAGLAIGFRPEVFERIKGLPGIDVAGEIFAIAWERDFDLGRLTDAAKKLATVILDEVNVGLQTTTAVAESLDAIGAIVQVVWGAIDMVVTNVKADHEAAEAWQAATLDCTPLAYGATADGSLVNDALTLMGKSQSWEDLFLPVVRPFDKHGQFLGFTCCATTMNRGRMVAPVGLGLGNRWQSGIGGEPSPGMNQVAAETYGVDNAPGYGCLPMCPTLPVHRAIIVPGAGSGSGGPYGGTYDPARALPQLGGLGIYVWHMLWARGPSVYAVDGDKIADAWSEYFMSMRRYIGFNEKRPLGSPTLQEGWGAGIPNADLACDYWPENRRQQALEWLYEQIGVPKRWADPEGIYTFADSLPVREWRRFAALQESLRWRPVIAYVDAATCHPNWRVRVAEAQAMLLEHPTAVCGLDLDSIPNPSYRAKVIAARSSKGGVCYMAGTDVAAPVDVSASEGPSLLPLYRDAPEMPSFPLPRRVPRLSGQQPSRVPLDPGRVPELGEFDDTTTTPVEDDLEAGGEDLGDGGGAALAVALGALGLGVGALMFKKRR